MASGGSDTSKAARGRNNNMNNDTPNNWRAGVMTAMLSGGAAIKKENPEKERERSLSQSKDTHPQKHQRTPRSLPRTGPTAAECQSVESLRQRLAFDTDSEVSIGRRENVLNGDRQASSESWLSTYSASNGAAGGNDRSSQDSNQIVGRLMHIRSYLKQAVARADQLRQSSADTPRSREELNKVVKLIQHLKDEEDDYMNMLQLMLATKKPTDSLGNLDMSTDSKDEMSDALSIDAADGQSDISEATTGTATADKEAELKALQQHRDLLRQMLDQQKQLKSLHERQAQLLELQRKAESRLMHEQGGAAAAADDRGTAAGIVDGNASFVEEEEGDDDRSELSDEEEGYGEDLHQQKCAERLPASSGEKMARSAAAGAQLDSLSSATSAAVPQELYDLRQRLNYLKNVFEDKVQHASGAKQQQPAAVAVGQKKKQAQQRVAEDRALAPSERELSQLGAASSGSEAADERRDLEGKLQKLQEKKAHMDELLNELQALRSQRRLLASSGRDGNSSFPGTAADDCDSSTTTSSLVQLHKSAEVAESAGSTAGRAKTVLDVLEQESQMRKLQDMHDHLNQLKELMQYYQQGSRLIHENGGGDGADEESSYSSESSSDDGPQQEDEVGADGEEDMSLLGNLRTALAARRGIPPSDHQQQAEEAAAAGWQSEDSAAAASTSSLGGAYGDDPEIQEKVRKLRAAKDKLARLQRLVAFAQGRTAGGSTLSPLELTELAASLEGGSGLGADGDTASQASSVATTTTTTSSVAAAAFAEKYRQSVAAAAEREELEKEYETKLVEQKRELEALAGERRRLVAVQQQLLELQEAHKVAASLAATSPDAVARSARGAAVHGLAGSEQLSPQQQTSTNGGGGRPLRRKVARSPAKGASSGSAASQARQELAAKATTTLNKRQEVSFKPRRLSPPAGSASTACNGGSCDDGGGMSSTSNRDDLYDRIRAQRMLREELRQRGVELQRLVAAAGGSGRALRLRTSDLAACDVLSEQMGASVVSAGDLTTLATWGGSTFDESATGGAEDEEEDEDNQGSEEKNDGSDEENAAEDVEQDDDGYPSDGVMQVEEEEEEGRDSDNHTYTIDNEDDYQFRQRYPADLAAAVFAASAAKTGRGSASQRKPAMRSAAVTGTRRRQLGDSIERSRHNSKAAVTARSSSSVREPSLRDVTDKLDRTSDLCEMLLLDQRRTASLLQAHVLPDPVVFDAAVGTSALSGRRGPWSQVYKAAAAQQQHGSDKAQLSQTVYAVSQCFSQLQEQRLLTQDLTDQVAVLTAAVARQQHQGSSPETVLEPGMSRDELTSGMYRPEYTDYLNHAAAWPYSYVGAAAPPAPLWALGTHSLKTAYNAKGAHATSTGHRREVSAEDDDEKTLTPPQDDTVDQTPTERRAGDSTNSTNGHRNSRPTDVRPALRECYQSLIGSGAAAIEEVPPLRLDQLKSSSKGRRSGKRGDVFNQSACRLDEPTTSSTVEHRPGLSSGICGTTAFSDTGSLSSAISSVRAANCDEKGTATATGTKGRVARIASDLESEAETPSEFSLFEALRESIYSEVATLISQNENRPHYLIELFRELQMLTSDYLRQRALYAVQDLVTRFLTEEKIMADADESISAPPPAWMLYNENNSEQTPSESAVTTEDEEDLRGVSSVCPDVRRPSHIAPHCHPSARDLASGGSSSLAAGSAHSSVAGGSSIRFDYAENAETGSSLSTPPSQYGAWDSYFAEDSLEGTVIHLEKAMAQVREYERQHNERVSDGSIGVVHPKSSDSTNKNVTASDQASDCSTDAAQHYTRVDTRQLDRQIKAIMAELIPVLKEHMEDVCSQPLLAYLRGRVLSLVRLPASSSEQGQEFVRFFHRQLGSILQDSLSKFEGSKMRECGEDLLVDVSEILFNELAFFRLMQDLDDPQVTAAGGSVVLIQEEVAGDAMAASEHQGGGEERAASERSLTDGEQGAAMGGGGNGEGGDSVDSSAESVSEDDEEEERPEARDSKEEAEEEENLGKDRDDAMASTTDVDAVAATAAAAGGSRVNAYPFYSGAISPETATFELARSESKPMTRMGSDEEDEEGEDDSEETADDDSASDTAVARQAARDGSSVQSDACASYPDDFEDAEPSEDGDQCEARPCDDNGDVNLEDLPAKLNVDLAAVALKMAVEQGTSAEGGKGAIALATAEELLGDDELLAGSGDALPDPVLHTAGSQPRDCMQSASAITALGPGGDCSAVHARPTDMTGTAVVTMTASEPQAQSKVQASPAGTQAVSGESTV